MSSLLKFITCGSVDDGKSTLIGNLLYNAKLIFADQRQALELDSKVGSADGEIDYSLLLDGLMAEREQGITIDVAYRYFNTEKRSFIVADCPGHEQYTRNMAVGASFASLAVILVDATKGIQKQTRRHVRICSLMGIRNFVLVVNKMDVISYDEQAFDKISEDFKAILLKLNVDSFVAIPVSATNGDNVVTCSENTAWYSGKSLLDYLESVEMKSSTNHDDFILPIQRVSRPNQDFRGFQGEIVSGQIQIGDQVTVLPSREKSEVKEIFVGNMNVDCASSNQPVTITLQDEIDVSRGSTFVKDNKLEVSNTLKTTLLWMDDTPLVEGKNFILNCGTKQVPATVLKIKNKVDINTFENTIVDKVDKNDLVTCTISLGEKIVFDSFSKNKGMGRFILVDRMTNMTSACGTIDYSLRRSDNLFWQETEVAREVRAEQKSQKPITIWFTGLSGSGKSTIASALEKRLVELGKHTMILDGDNVRQGLNKNLGFEEKDRIENIRRTAEVAKLMNDAGLVVITSFISPFEADREKAREIIGEDFVLVHVSTSLEVCEIRDIKGLYKKARNNEIPNFTGISSPFELPTKAEITVDTFNSSIESSVDYVLNILQEKFM